MKTRNLIVFIILILALTGGIYYYSKNKNTKEPVVEVPTPAKPALTVDKSLIEEKTYTESTKYATFKVSYPQFKNASPAFNQKIEELMTTGIEQHKKDSEDNWKARYETDPKNTKEFPTSEEKFQFYSSYTPIQTNAKFISVLITFGGYTGGAHGYQNLVSFNYDVVNKKEVTLKNLRPNDSNYLKTISEFSRKDLTVQFRKRLEVKTKEDEKVLQESVVPMMELGTEPTLENFSVFTFTDKAITFYFTQYQVAPYAMGESKVVFPL